MPFDYIRAQATALRLIAKFGFDMKIARVAESYDPVAGVNSEQVVTSQDATVVNLPGSSGSKSFDDRFIEDLKKGKIRFFYVAAKGLEFAPGAGDVFPYDGKLYDVAGTTPLNPAGVPVLYTMAGRESGRNLESIFPS